MLQQTQVATVIPYFEKWMRQFPTVESLASAKEDEAMALWQGLGYYSRCRAMLAAAREVAAAGMPRDADGWRKLPGVGDYTAGAVCSIAFGERVPAVDGNVERVFARQQGSTASGGALKQAATAWAAALADCDNPGEINQALMELGATVCSRSRPDCPECPVSATCVALATGRVEDLPVRQKKPPMVDVGLTYYVLESQGSLALKRYGADSWWSGLFGLPDSFSGGAERVGAVRHTVTRHRLAIDVFYAAIPTLSADYEWVPLDRLPEVAISAASRKAIVCAGVGQRQRTGFIEADDCDVRERQRDASEENQDRGLEDFEAIAPGEPVLAMQ